MYVVTALPTYQLGPDQASEELVVNLLIYGMLLALLLSVLWVLRPFGQSLLDRRRRR